MGTVVALALPALGGAWFVQQKLERDRACLQALASRCIGRNEAAARAIMGPPLLMIARRNLSDYPVTGWQAPRRGPSDRILVYLRGHLVCYVFLGSKGIVEETFCGLS